MRRMGTPSRRWVLVAAIVGSGMAFVDGTVVNVALPAIQQGLDATAADGQWVIEAYALLLAALLLPGGALGDHFGRRRMFMLGTALFTIASAACAAAPNAEALIAARALQGLGAALLVPGSLTLLSAAYPQAERGRAIGTWSAFSGMAAAVGPVLGGFLVDHVSWRWAFLINLPPGALLLAICATRVEESHGEASRAPVDLPGAALATLGLGAVVFALIEAPTHGAGSARVVASALVGLAALAAFVAVERRRASPMLPLGLFAGRDFSGANLLTLLLYAALGALMFFLPQNLIQVQGRGATFAGAALLPIVVLMSGLSRWAGGLVDRHGSRLPLVVGPAIAAAGFGLFALPGTQAGYWGSFFPAICVLGLGMTITVAPLTTTVMNAVATDQAGVASGVNNAVSRTGGLLAIAVFGVLLSAVFDAGLAAALPGLHLPPDAVEHLRAQRSKLAGLAPPPGLAPASAEALKQAVAQAFVAGFRAVMLTCAGLALASALCAAWLISPRSSAPPSR